MKPLLSLLSTLIVVSLSGCATSDDVYMDEQEYSDMPWATPEKWEAGPGIPGMSGPQY